MITDFTLSDHFRCPYCNTTGLCLTVDEWEESDEGGIPTETGCHVSCPNEQIKPGSGNSLIDSDHDEMPYVYWLPLEVRVARWARKHIRIVESEEETRERLRQWNAGEPLRV